MDQASQIKELLTPYTVLDLTDEKGYFCSKILGDLGARVTRIEDPGTTHDLDWWAYNSDKDIVRMQIQKEREKFISMVKEADFLIESFPPGYLGRLNLGYDTLKAINPKLIMTSISPYGQTGPYKDFKASDLEVMAMSGFTYVMGDQDRPPIRIGAPQAYLIGAAEAATGSLIAHHWRVKTGQGQHVDVSAREAAKGGLMQGPYFWSWFKKNPERTGSERYGVNGAMFLHPIIWPCKDGYISFMLQGAPQGVDSNNSLMKYILAEGNVPDFFRDIKWEKYILLEKSQDELAKVWDVFGTFFQRHTRREIYDIVLKEKVQLFPVNTFAEIVKDEQLSARGFWRDGKGPDGREMKFPGSFARVVLSPPAAGRGASDAKNGTDDTLPFAGIRIADFSWVAAAPWMTGWLAEYGAEVIKIESRNRVDASRQTGPYKENKVHPDRSAMHYVFNGCKKGITLNLNNPKGQEIAKRLVAKADIAVESFAPGKMQDWGLGFDVLRELNPGIIIVSSSMMGQTGPHASQPGLGFLLAPLAGFTNLSGWPDRTPANIYNAYTDVLSSRILAPALLAAIDFKRRTGRGCYIDTAQYEASLQYLAPSILEYQTTGNPGQRIGNRSPDASPHGTFPCKGQNRWCSLSVFTDEEWGAFCAATGHPEWVTDPKFATLRARKSNEDALEKLISDWTVQLAAEEVMTRLQQAGVNAGVVLTCEDLYNDPQLAHRKHTVPVQQRELGEYDYMRTGIRLEKVEQLFRGAPCMGEHNEEVYKGIVGMSDEEMKEALDAGALK